MSGTSRASVGGVERRARGRRPGPPRAASRRGSGRGAPRCAASVSSSSRNTRSGAARAVDEREVARPARERLEQRPQRRDPDAAGDQRHAAPRPAGAGEDRRTGPRRRPASRPRIARIRRLSSPRSLTVNRSQRPFGADEIEYGWARHHPSRVRNRITKYWPDRTASRSRSTPVRYTETSLHREDRHLRQHRGTRAARLPGGLSARRGAGGLEDHPCVQRTVGHNCPMTRSSSCVRGWSRSIRYSAVSVSCRGSACRSERTRRRSRRPVRCAVRAGDRELLPDRSDQPCQPDHGGVHRRLRGHAAVAGGGIAASSTIPV